MDSGRNFITVQTTVNVSLETAWDAWTRPDAIIHWNFASDEWHAPSARNDLRNGGVFSWRMEAKDGSMGFDFSGVYDQVVLHTSIGITLDDGRKVTLEFSSNGSETTLVEIFEAETENPLELQQLGWQAILNNYKKYVEAR